SVVALIGEFGVYEIPGGKQWRDKRNLAPSQGWSYERRCRVRDRRQDHAARLITAFRASRGVPPTERDESFAQRAGASSRDVVVVKHLPDREIVVLHQQQFRSRRFQLKEAFDRR